MISISLKSHLDIEINFKTFTMAKIKHTFTCEHGEDKKGNLPGPHASVLKRLIKMLGACACIKSSLTPGAHL